MAMGINYRAGVAGSNPDAHEDRGLLSGYASEEDVDDEDVDTVVLGPLRKSPRTSRSSPRSSNRVRFNLPPSLNADADGNASDLSPLSGRCEPRAQAPPLLQSPTTIWDDGDVDVEELAVREYARPKSSMRAAFMNMANSIIGAGIIGQPYAFRQAGLLAGIILLVILTIMVDWTVRLIVLNSKLSGRSSFQGTVEHCFGQTGLVAISLAQWAFAFGGMVAFGVIVGDSIPQVLLAIWPWLRDIPVLGLLADRKAVIVILILGISYPLSLYRDIAKLTKASTLALISMIIILSTVTTQGFLVSPESRGTFERPLLTINNGIFQAVGVISFAFVCHHNSLLIYHSLRTPTMDRFSRVTHYSTGISMLACLVMALAGFLTFGSLTQGNVLNNFPSDNTMANLARLCFGLNMLTTFPLEAFVCRDVISLYFFPSAPFDVTRHVLLSSALVFAALLLSLAICDLGAIFELVGATSACVLAYILPPLCYLKLSSRSWRSLPAVACVVFGFAVLLSSLLQTAVKIFRPGPVVQCR